MMFKLQGVIILRISDFRRFFDWDEFWAKKDDFIKFFSKEANKKFFADNHKELLLLQRFYMWLLNPSKELPNIKLNVDKGELQIGDYTSDTPQVYPLGKRLQEEIKKVKKLNLMTDKTLTGYTLLYLLLGANVNTDIKINYIAWQNDSIKYLYENKKLLAFKGKLPLDVDKHFEYKLLVNKHSDAISIGHGYDNYKLSSNECMVGIFCNNECFKLLPNIERVQGVTLQLFFDDIAGRTSLRITGNIPRDFVFPDNTNRYMDENGNIIYYYIDDVVSFTANDYGFVAIDKDMNMIISHTWNALRRKIELCSARYSEDKILYVIDETQVVTDKRIF